MARIQRRRADAYCVQEKILIIAYDLANFCGGTQKSMRVTPRRDSPENADSARARLYRYRMLLMLAYLKYSRSIRAVEDVCGLLAPRTRVNIGQRVFSAPRLTRRGIICRREISRS